MASASIAFSYDVQVSFVEAYTPSGSQIVSPFTGKTLSYAFFMTDIDGTVSVVCLGGNTETINVKGGVPYPFGVTKITATTATKVFILHNGKQI